MSESTGERVSLESSQQSIEELLIYFLHERTYRHAMTYVEGKTVLEFGCGDGYGTRMLAERAVQVTGIDVSLQTIEAARLKYAARNLHFQHVRDVSEADLPFAERTFDVVVSFQVIEHVASPDRYLMEAARVLKKGGVILVSTPNAAARLLPFQNPWNKFHLKEYTPAQLKDQLAHHFHDIRLNGLSFQPPWLEVETRRANRNKWTLFPLTHICVPDAVRRKLLQGVWSLSRRLRRPPGLAAATGPLPVIEDAIVTSDVTRAPSLLAIAHK